MPRGDGMQGPDMTAVQHPEVGNSGEPFSYLAKPKRAGQGEEVATEPCAHKEGATWQQMSP